MFGGLLRQEIGQWWKQTLNLGSVKSPYFDLLDLYFWIIGGKHWAAATLLQCSLFLEILFSCVHVIRAAFISASILRRHVYLGLLLFFSSLVEHFWSNRPLAGRWPATRGSIVFLRSLLGMNLPVLHHVKLDRWDSYTVVEWWGWASLRNHSDT